MRPNCTQEELLYRTLLLEALKNHPKARELGMKIEEEMGAGTWMVTFSDGFCLFATPFYEGSRGLPIDIVDREGRQVACFELSFSSVNDIELDALEYLDVVSRIPHMVISALGRK